MTLKPRGRGARKRSRIVILASSEADQLLVGRAQLWGWSSRLSRRIVPSDGLDSSDALKDAQVTHCWFYRRGAR
jgi:hypothetical protein